MNITSDWSRVIILGSAFQITVRRGELDRNDAMAGGQPEEAISGG